ncbi:MAG: branched-chain amino acid transport system substrate-binding protein [Saliniramus fredricksonii]|uniref:Amino acid/amide ABC transporter substrate-binding protein, HAAT family n=1 Tax=Saliniramus fredricksonii TaxID=1653334 RepID=A0A0P8A230_9HYPH|nr:ABC transporter substrate-binding protein [Saliniramus fredricksonii]KPQ09216.1 MAG: branched-chain amino acid transport system substrate-binding protein [Saliniramus fredricksonii]SCC82059.1 amino acid/amide ABC transporter substrate-binding protein, HAAT family [Saliniramus fredricksonii]
MKKLMLATAASALLVAAPTAKADSVNVGILLGFTGPIESITPAMAAAAELAFSEVNESGLLLDGMTIEAVRGDSTCGDAAAATAAAERLVTSDDVAAIVGADCSGASIAVANNVAIPNGVVMVSPSSTSPALTTIDDDDYFFRTAPSDARQGQVVADIVWERGIDTVAITYTNNDYGRGLSEAFTTTFEELGGTVAINAAHEDGRADYSAEVGALAAAGADDLIVFGYVDQGGRGIIQASLDIDAFENFVLADGMFGDSLIEAIGPELDGRAFGTVPGSDLEGADIFLELAEEAEFDGSSSFTGESYDAGALIALAMQAAGSTDRTAIRDAMMSVANAPGEEILPGEIAKGLEILANGGEIDYVGATGVELIGPGEAAGRYRIYEIDDGDFQTIEFR